MNYCSHCGGSVASQIPAGDNRPRFVCMECQTIHYQNPRIVAGCLPVWQEQVLLCRRAIEPRRGYWTLPAGFMENGETMQQAAARETLEEACAVVHRLQLYTLFDTAAQVSGRLLRRSAKTRVEAMMTAGVSLSGVADRVAAYAFTPGPQGEIGRAHV